MYSYFCPLAADILTLSRWGKMWHSNWPNYLTVFMRRELSVWHLKPVSWQLDSIKEAIVKSGALEEFHPCELRGSLESGKFLVNPLKGGLMLQDWCVGMPTKTTVVLLNGITVMKGRESINFCQSVQTQSEFDSYYKADRLSQTVPDCYFYSIKCPSGLYLNAQCLLDFIFSVLMCSVFTVCPLSKMTPLCRDWTSLDIYKLERWS